MKSMLIILGIFVVIIVIIIIIIAFKLWNAVKNAGVGSETVSDYENRINIWNRNCNSTNLKQ